VHILGIETSCDETAAGVVADGQRILSNIVASQIDLHRRFGGVVPEIACRAHVEAIVPVAQQALDRADIGLDDLAAVAVVNRPGLIGSLLIGLAFVKGMAFCRDIPLVAVNHVEAHTHACKLAYPDLCYPYVSLVASGGHTILFLITSPLDHVVLGQTLDDAAGEAFDKVANILQLGYPGGPAIEEQARNCVRDPVHFPRTFMSPGNCDFSFSGIKTAVLYHVYGQNKRRGDALPIAPEEVTRVAAGFQEAMVDMLTVKTINAARQCGVSAVTVGGGVACNGALRRAMEELGASHGLRVCFPPRELCTDNGAMVAALAYYRLKKGLRETLDLDAYPSMEVTAR